MSKTYQTGRLLLQPTGYGDEVFLMKLLNTESYHKYIGDRNVRSYEDAQRYILERCLPQHQQLGYGSFTVIRKLDGVKMGTCGIYAREGLNVQDIGFAFLPEFENKGYGFESASKLMEVGKTEFGLKKISAITTKENFPSQKLIKKLGLEFKSFTFLPNDPEELMYFEGDINF